MAQIKEASEFGREREKWIGSLGNSITDLRQRAYSSGYPDTSRALDGLSERLNAYHLAQIRVARINTHYRILDGAFSMLAGAAVGIAVGLGASELDQKVVSGMSQYAGPASAFAESYFPYITGALAGGLASVISYITFNRSTRKARERGMMAAENELESAITQLYRAQGGIGMPDSIGDLKGTVLERTKATIDFISLRLDDLGQGERHAGSADGYASSAKPSMQPVPPVPHVEQPQHSPTPEYNPRERSSGNDAGTPAKSPWSDRRDGRRSSTVVTGEGSIVVTKPGGSTVVDGETIVVKKPGRKIVVTDGEIVMTDGFD